MDVTPVAQCDAFSEVIASIVIGRIDRSLTTSSRSLYSRRIFINLARVSLSIFSFPMETPMILLSLEAPSPPPLKKRPTFSISSGELIIP
jgi:hypothetical protein